MMHSVDEEWLNYIHQLSEPSKSTSAATTTISPIIHKKKPINKIESYKPSYEDIKIEESDSDEDDNKKPTASMKSSNNSSKHTPTVEDVEKMRADTQLFISTKTKVLYLNQSMDIHNIFWKIPVIEYWEPKIGVVKKQIKVVSKTPDEYEEYKKKLDNLGYYREHIIKQIDSTTSRRVKYRDERKITIGISKKDIMNCRGKVKNAFYNCFAIIARFKYENQYREIHIKVFNTGKLEIPGILNPGLLEVVKQLLLDIIQPHIDTPISYLEYDTEENVLINSNFNCGFYINRDKLYHILHSEKYHIESAYDPCSYPGVKCKFYFNNEIGFDKERQNGQILLEDRSMKMSELGENSKYTEISFMIFRTGSCLIVGNCTERILTYVFEFIKNILFDEYYNIVVENNDNTERVKKTKIRKRTIIVT